MAVLIVFGRKPMVTIFANSCLRVSDFQHVVLEITSEMYYVPNKELSCNQLCNKVSP